MVCFESLLARRVLLWYILLVSFFIFPLTLSLTLGCKFLLVGIDDNARKEFQAFGVFNIAVYDIQVETVERDFLGCVDFSEFWQGQTNDIAFRATRFAGGFLLGSASLATIINICLQCFNKHGKSWLWGTMRIAYLLSLLSQGAMFSVFASEICVGIDGQESHCWMGKNAVAGVFNFLLLFGMVVATFNSFPPRNPVFQCWTGEFDNRGLKDNSTDDDDVESVHDTASRRDGSVSLFAPSKHSSRHSTPSIVMSQRTVLSKMSKSSAGASVVGSHNSTMLSRVSERSSRANKSIISTNKPRNLHSPVEPIVNEVAPVVENKLSEADGAQNSTTTSVVGSRNSTKASVVSEKSAISKLSSISSTNNSRDLVLPVVSTVKGVARTEEDKLPATEEVHLSADLEISESMEAPESEPRALLSPSKSFRANFAKRLWGNSKAKKSQVPPSKPDDSFTGVTDRISHLEKGLKYGRKSRAQTVQPQGSYTAPVLSKTNDQTLANDTDIVKAKQYPLNPEDSESIRFLHDLAAVTKLGKGGIRVKTTKKGHVVEIVDEYPAKAGEGLNAPHKSDGADLVKVRTEYYDQGSRTMKEVTHHDGSRTIVTTICSIQSDKREGADSISTKQSALKTPQEVVAEKKMGEEHATSIQSGSQKSKRSKQSKTSESSKTNYSDKQKQTSETDWAPRD